MSPRCALLIAGFGLFFNSPCIAQELKFDVAAVKTLVSEWNAAHTLNNVEMLSSLYSDTVSFYGSILRREKCVSIKKALLEKDEDFRQTLKNELVLSGYSSGAIRCDFVKTVSRNNKTVDYSAYLIVKQFHGSYLVVGESDLVTDRNIKNELNLGTRVTIKEVKDLLVNEPIDEKGASAQLSSHTLTEVIVGTSFAVGIIGLLIAWGIWRKRTAPKRPEHITKDPQPSESFEKGLALLQMTRKLSASQGSEYRTGGPEQITKEQERSPTGPQPTHKDERELPLPTTPKTTPHQASGSIAKGPQAPGDFEKGSAFEGYIVHQFAINKDFFTLLDWRSDKFYRGVYPKSSRNPDLVYEFRAGNFVRKFSVECKYRGKAFNGLIKLMDEDKYRIYATFNKNEMPVYIALGIGGKPDSPAELYLIPFKDVKTEMPHDELSKYRSPGMFYYDRDIDQLT